MADYESYSSTPWYEYSSYIKTVIIANGITGIGLRSFSLNSALTRAAISDTVETIAAGAFNETGLTDVYYGGSEEEWRGITIGAGNDPLTRAGKTFSA